MSNKQVRVEICHNINGSLSLCICDNSGGYRISGAKIGACETLKVFTVDADELIEAIQNHSFEVTNHDN